MAPESSKCENNNLQVPVEKDDLGLETLAERKELPDYTHHDIVWHNIFLLGGAHIAAIYGLYLAITAANWWTLLFILFMGHFGGLGLTAGAHRLWSHRAYKATLPLRFLLVIMNTCAFQGSIFVWARDHRMHHKFSETNADPHNPRRGFFYAHVGWLFLRKHPDVSAKAHTIDLTDLYEDKLVMFQHKYYTPLVVLGRFVLPTIIPLAWGEDLMVSYYVSGILTWVLMLNMTFSINSFGHKFGNHIYDKDIFPADNYVIAVFTHGEGWHNYHHVFPWDYRTVEFKTFKIDTTTRFIELFARIGWAYDLKTASPELVKKRVERTGDGTHPIWGWGDKETSTEDKLGTVILPKAHLA